MRKILKHAGRVAVAAAVVVTPVAICYAAGGPVAALLSVAGWVYLLTA
jgi:hypothetical protein